MMSKSSKKHKGTSLGWALLIVGVFLAMDLMHVGGISLAFMDADALIALVQHGPMTIEQRGEFVHDLVLVVSFTVGFSIQLFMSLYFGTSGARALTATKRRNWGRVGHMLMLFLITAVLVQCFRMVVKHPDIDHLFSCVQKGGAAAFLVFFYHKVQPFIFDIINHLRASREPNVDKPRQKRAPREVTKEALDPKLRVAAQ